MGCTQFLHPPDQNICLCRARYRAVSTPCQTLPFFPLWLFQLEITPKTKLIFFFFWTFSCEHAGVLGRLHHAETLHARCNLIALLGLNKRLLWVVDFSRRSLKVKASVWRKGPLGGIVSLWLGMRLAVLLQARRPDWWNDLVPFVHSRGHLSVSRAVPMLSTWRCCCSAAAQNHIPAVWPRDGTENQKVEVGHGRLLQKSNAKQTYSVFKWLIAFICVGRL